MTEPVLLDVPDFQTLMLPLLREANTGVIHNRDAIARLSDTFGLSEQARVQMVPSGQQTRIGNNTTWAKTYLKKADLLKYTGRGLFTITDRGRQVLQTAPERIDTAFLKQFESFEAFHSPTGQEAATGEAVADPGEDLQTPDERIHSLHASLNSDLATELIERIQEMPPAFFERTLVQLLIAMGYGGTAEDAGRDLGQSGDGGVDGVIDQDRLGVDQIYIQAKRYADGNSVGSGAIRDFFGALNMKRATKGIFFTTSVFTQSARDTAAALSSRIVLIDGSQLARLMIENDVGCRKESTLVIRRIDEDFFDPT